MPEAFPYKIRKFPITGKLIEVDDPITIGDNYQQLVNLRPTENRKRSIAGMTKITTAALTFSDTLSRAAKIRNAIHFVKEEPYESHIVVEAYNYAENSLALYSLDGDVPDTDTFGTALYTIASAWTAGTAYAKGDLVFPVTPNGYYYECIFTGTSHTVNEPTWPTTDLQTVTDSTAVWVCRKGSLHGAFSVTDAGELIYASNHKLLIWPGDEHKIGAVINASNTAWPMPDMDDMYDVTDRMLNTLTNDENVMVVTGFDVHSGHYDSDVYVGSPYQLSGAKFYVQNPVGYTSGTTTCDTAYWKAGGFTTVTNTDGTSVGGKTLSQTGEIVFDTDTVGLAKPTLVFGRMLFWYRFRFHSIPLSTNRPVVFFITVLASIQPMTDIWDGTPVPLVGVWKSPSDNKYYDVATNVANMDDVFIMGASLQHAKHTSIDISAFKTDDKMYFGATVRLCGLKFLMAKDKKSDTERNKAAAVVLLDYFNGKAWTSVSDTRDGTSQDGVPLWQSGIVTFTPPDPDDEFQTCVKNDTELFYYRVGWNATLSLADIIIDQVLGIPAPITINGQSRAFTAQGRLFIVKGNTLECSPVNRPTVMNGSEHTSFAIGDDTDITGGCQLFNIQGSDYHSPILVFKKTATYLLAGTGPSWQRHDLSMYDGLAAPDTLCVINLPIAVPGLASTIAIGQGTNSVFLCDGRPPLPIHKDIAQYFDTLHDDCIPADMLDKSVGFIDYENLEYHWLFASGAGQTTLNKEMVYSLKKLEWFEVDRENSVLQFGISVVDEYRKRYTYGICNDGYVKRLEYGTDFDGEAITCVMWPGDITMTGDITIETKIEQVQLLCVAKEVTTDNISYEHYCDTNIDAMKDTATLLAPRAAGKRVASIIAKLKTPAAVFHSGKFTFTCDDEVISFEPLDLAYHYELEKQRTRPTQGTADDGSIYFEGV
jgi:hypothetical protein